MADLLRRIAGTSCLLIAMLLLLFDDSDGMPTRIERLPEGFYRTINSSEYFHHVELLDDDNDTVWVRSIYFKEDLPLFFKIEGRTLKEVPAPAIDITDESLWI